MRTLDTPSPLAPRPSDARLSNPWRPLFHAPTLALALLALSIGLPLACPAGSLDSGFRNPPPEARPWAYWFFMDGNMTREGITADLEAMAKAGLGGGIFMEVDVGIPRGPVQFMSPRWQELFRYAVKEAQRLGLEPDPQRRPRLDRQRRAVGPPGAIDATPGCQRDKYHRPLAFRGTARQAGPAPALLRRGNPHPGTQKGQGRLLPRRRGAGISGAGRPGPHCRYR